MRGRVDVNDSSESRQVVDLTARRSRLLGPLQRVRKHSTATGSARGVLNVLASYADADTLEVRVGRDLLGRQAGVSRSTLRRAIRRLEELGELDTVAVGIGDRASHYRITLGPPVDNRGVSPVDNATPPGRERVQSEPGEGSPRTRGRVQSEPLPIGGPISTGEGETPRTCSRHAGVDNPPPCRACRDKRLAADAADQDAAERARAARLCPHGVVDGTRVLGDGTDAARLCLACETDAPAETLF